MEVAQIALSWKKECSCIAFSTHETNDSSPPLMALGFDDGTIALSNCDKDLEMRLFLEANCDRWFVRLAFSPRTNAHLLASSQYGGFVRLWHTKERTLVETILIYIENQYVLAFSPDGSQLAIGSGSSEVTLWQTDTKKVGPVIRASSGLITNAVFSPDSMLLVLAFDQRVEFWHLPECDQAHVGLEPSPIHCIEFSPVLTDYLFALGTHDGTVKLFDLYYTGKVVTTIKAHEVGLNSVDFSPDGKSIVTSTALGTDTAVKVWRTDNGSLIEELLHQTRIKFARFHPNGRQIVCITYDNTLLVWTLKGLPDLEQSLSKLQLQ
jgi:WD40 repeat protein